MLCPKCGAKPKKGAAFCGSCGEPVVNKRAPRENGGKEFRPDENAKPKSVGSSAHGIFSVKGYFRNLARGFKALLKDPKRLVVCLLPSVLIGICWIILSLLEGYRGKVNKTVQILSVLTYSQGGMFGKFFEPIGGILGKALFSYVLCALVTAAVYGRKIKFKELFRGFSVRGISSLGIILTGAGTASLLYLAFNMTSSFQNIMVAVSGIGLTALTASGGGLAMYAVCGIAGLLSGGKTPSSIDVSRFLSGMTAGFTLAIPLSFFRAAWIIPVISALLLVSGIVLCIVGGKMNKSKAAALTALLLILPSILVFQVAASDDDKPEADRVYIHGVLHDTSETRKGVPLKDYDRDDDIDYFDRMIQYELIHDPDYLTRHGKAGSVAVAVFSLISAVAGGVASAAVSAASAISGTYTFPASENSAQVVSENSAQVVSDNSASAEDAEYQRQMAEYKRQMETAARYVREDEYGNIVWRDPASGREQTYERREDGTYGDGLTADDINQNTLHIIRNMSYYAENNENLNRQAAEYEMLADQYKRNWDAYYDKLAENDRNAQIERAKALAAAEQKRLALRKKYNLSESAGDDVVKDVIRMNQEYEKGLRKMYEASAEFYDDAVWYAEVVSTGADIAMDALEIMAGPMGETLNAGYKVVKGATGKGMQAYYEGGDVGVAVLQGGIEGGIDAGTAFVSAPGYNVAATVAGETAKEALGSYIKGEDVLEGAKKGFIAGGIKAAVDASFEIAGDSLNEMTEEVGKNLSKKVGASTAKKITAAVEHISTAVDVSGSIADNLAKNYIAAEMERAENKTGRNDAAEKSAASALEKRVIRK